MKKIFALFIFLYSIFEIGHAQSDTWKISLGNKELQSLKVGKNPDTITIYLTKSQISREDSLVIEYTEAHLNKEWNRTFIFYNGQTELLHFDFQVSSGIYGLPMKKIAPKLHDNSSLTIYTFSLPKDKALAATVRVRRILICKLIYKI